LVFGDFHPDIRGRAETTAGLDIPLQLIPEVFQDWPANSPEYQSSTFLHMFDLKRYAPNQTRWHIRIVDV